MRSSIDRGRALAVFGALCAAAAGAFVLYRYDPVAAGSFYPQCIFHMLTGYDCPGCGTTRALHALLHGHFGAAYRFNPMLLLYGPLLAWGAADAARAFVTRAPLNNVTSRPWLAWSMGVTLAGWWIVRNTPLWLG